MSTQEDLSQEEINLAALSMRVPDIHCDGGPVFTAGDISVHQLFSIPPDVREAVLIGFYSLHRRLEEARIKQAQEAQAEAGVPGGAEQ